MKTKTQFPQITGDFSGDVAFQALRMTLHVEDTVGDHSHQRRQLFEDAVDLLLRQAKRVALEAFDQAAMAAVACETREAAKH